MSSQPRSRTRHAAGHDEQRERAAEAPAVGTLPPPAERRQASPGRTIPEPLTAPTRLMAETRVTFRREALAYVEEAALDGRGSVDVDVGQTVEIDAGGLGLLVLVQRRARTHGLPTRLLHAREQVRRLLALTKLDYLFEFVD